MYKAYFDCYLGNQDKSWASHVSCLTCVKILSDWDAEKKCSHAVWCANNLAWAERSGCTAAKKKKAHCLPKFAISNAPSRALRKFTCAHTFRSRNAEFHQF